MRLRRPSAAECPRRTGVTTVEAALVFGVFFLLIFGMLDLGIAVFHAHLVAEAAPLGARLASVHGQRATLTGPWGPAPLGPLAGNDPHPLAQAIGALLVGIPPGATSIQAEWLDGSNAPDARVRVTVTVAHYPVLVNVFGAAPMMLRSSSTLRIAH